MLLHCNKIYEILGKNEKTEKICLKTPQTSCILTIAVTLIALKREVATVFGRFSVERMSS